MLDKVALTARNNALWCDAMCRAHGQPTEFTNQLWICRGTPPRYHSNLTTLAPGSREEVEREMPGGFKDGFYDVEAGDLGYRELFEAEWIWMEPWPHGGGKLEWRRVLSDDELLAWEAGWAEGDDDAATSPRQFLATLLDNDDNAFLGGYQNGVLVAGCILNLTAPVIGLSNTFSLGISRDELWTELRAVSSVVYHDYPIVGYERGEDLEAALRVGFQSIGKLRVWLR